MRYTGKITIAVNYLIKYLDRTLQKNYRTVQCLLHTEHFLHQPPIVYTSQPFRYEVCRIERLKMAQMTNILI